MIVGLENTIVGLENMIVGLEATIVVLDDTSVSPQNKNLYVCEPLKFLKRHDCVAFFKHRDCCSFWFKMAGVVGRCELCDENVLEGDLYERFRDFHWEEWWEGYWHWNWWLDEWWWSWRWHPGWWGEWCLYHTSCVSELGRMRRLAAHGS